MPPELKTIHFSSANTTESLLPVLKSFVTTSFDDSKTGKLMDRFDTKFVFPLSVLPSILQEATAHYKLVTDSGFQLFGYQTQYYDTDNFDMYRDHHNGKLNRLKIRRREYLNSDKVFFEIKLFTNKGKTQKKRFETDNRHVALSKEEGKFVKKLTTFKPKSLSPTLNNRYQRIILIGNNGLQKVTFDVGMDNLFRGSNCKLSNLVIAEIKQPDNSHAPAIQNILKNYRILPKNFSKYCIGMSFLNPELKSNNFKSTISLIKTITNEYDLTSAIR